MQIRELDSEGTGEASKNPGHVKTGMSPHTLSGHPWLRDRVGVGAQGPGPDAQNLPNTDVGINLPNQK